MQIVTKRNIIFTVYVRLCSIEFFLFLFEKRRNKNISNLLKYNFHVYFGSIVFLFGSCILLVVLTSDSLTNTLISY